MGDDNSAKILLDKIYSNNKLYLKNDFRISEKQLENKLNKKIYDELIMFGQKPIIKNIYIETIAHKKQYTYSTNYNYDKLIEYINIRNYNTVISNNAGNYLCNNIYYHALKLEKEKYNNLKIIFIHIPELKNISDINDMSNIFSEYIKQ